MYHKNNLGFVRIKLICKNKFACHMRPAVNLSMAIGPPRINWVLSILITVKAFSLELVVPSHKEILFTPAFSSKIFSGCIQFLQN